MARDHSYWNRRNKPAAVYSYIQCLLLATLSPFAFCQEWELRNGRIFMGSPFDTFDSGFAEISASSEVGPFQIQLYWEPDSCWQDDCSYIEWCIQCEGHFCNEGDLLWIEPCRRDAPQQQFYWLPVLDVQYVDIDQSVVSAMITLGQIQTRAAEVTDGSDAGSPVEDSFLCLERDGLNDYYLQPCESSEQKQWFQGLAQADISGQPFEIVPMDVLPKDFTSKTKNCVNMQHHPRQFEEIINTSCEKARGYKTNLWQIVMNDDTAIDGQVQNGQEASTWDPRGYYRLREPRQDPRCRRDSTCGMCEGHCVSDEDCAGKLKCFERSYSEGNPVETPPGCYGEGVPRIDYCYAEQGN